ncbi:unnamed protein product [Closterium sp. NIES-65]|nr:unnamed protein product [Closterium sp. NIES-65]
MRELEYIDDMLEQDENADQENLSVPREQWRAADFVEEDMVYATIDVLVLDALRHLQTVERNSTLRQYTSWIYHYKRWAAKMLRQIRNKLPQEYRLTYVDEIGHYIRDNKKKNWDQEADVPRSYVWLHGPRMAARVEATIYRETELSIMREISVVRSEVRFMIRTKNERDINIREITLPDIFLYRLASTSSVNPENQPVVMVIAARNSKTSKDARLQQSYAARHLEAEFCAVGETGLWLHFILDQIGQFHGVRLILPVDTSTRASWYKKHLFFAKNDTDQGELFAASHQRWTRQLWDKNGVFCKRNVHAARAGGAKELAIDGTPRAEIAELGHWALDKMTRAYITAIPVGVVMKKADYSIYKQDYFLGRSRVEPSDKLLKLLAEHIFPGVDDMLKTVC